MKKQVGFLSGAPRVSTHPDAEVSGSRARLVGIIKGFEAMGWEIKPFIVGDRMSQKFSGKGSEQIVSSGFVRTLTVDIGRLTLGIVNSFKSWQELGDGVDWVYEYAATLQCFGWIFKRHNIPWILQTEAPLFYEAKIERNALVLSSLARWLEIRAYRKCDVLICVSEALREIVIEELGISPEKTVVVSNGVDTNFFDPKRYEPKRLFTGFTVGFVGSLYAWAGLDLLLEALGELRAKGFDISLVVVGDGSMRSALEAQAQQLGIASNIAFVGRVTWQEIPSYIAGFDLGFSGQVKLKLGKMYLSPVKLYEYMAMEKVAVASAFEEARQIISEGKTGFLFRPGDKDDLIRALSNAFNSRSLLPEMGCKAREEIVANHSWAARVKTLIEGVERVLEYSSGNDVRRTKAQ